MAKREKPDPKRAASSVKSGDGSPHPGGRPKKKPVHQTKIPGSFNLTYHSFEILRKYWKVLGGIAVFYLLATVFLASGLSNFISATSSLRQGRELSENAVSGAFSGFSELLAGKSQTGSAMQSLLIIILSLALIWSLRQLLAGQKITVKQAYYHSMFPFIPFVLVIFVIIIQLLPITIGTAALGIILSSVFTNDALVTMATTAVFVLLAAWSIYMLTSSVMALYIVTLPDMHPRDALRSAKNLVRARRWQLMRRLLFLPLFILLVMAAAVVPLILLLPAAAVIAFYLLGTLAVFFSHAYLYSLYRSLI